MLFSAQQAVKSLKAVLLDQGMFSHSRAQLITLVKHAGLRWPDALDAAAELSVYAVRNAVSKPNPWCSAQYVTRPSRWRSAMTRVRSPA
jgi:hypothetical protein